MVRLELHNGSIMVRSHQAVLPAEIAPLLDGLKTAEGFFVCDCDQTIVHWNEAAAQMLGRSAADVMGKPCHEVFAGRDAQNFRFCRQNCPVTQNARRGRTTADYDVIATRADGGDMWANVSVMLLKRPQSAPLVLHCFRDVTERRRVETFARRAMESLREIESFPNGQAEAETEEPRPTPVPPLSRREMQVLQLMAVGLSTKDIAAHLGVSPITARNHITHVIAKLGAGNRLQAVLYASRRHLI
jgi:PAS domain S-box-containing protein